MKRLDYDAWLTRDLPDYRDDEEESCVKVNGEQGDCPLDRATCRGCRYNEEGL